MTLRFDGVGFTYPAGLLGRGPRTRVFEDFSWEVPAGQDGAPRPQRRRQDHPARPRRERADARGRQRADGDDLEQPPGVSGRVPPGRWLDAAAGAGDGRHVLPGAGRLRGLAQGPRPACSVGGGGRGARAAWTSRPRRAAARPSSRAASSDGSASPRRSSTGPTCCSSTSRPRGSIPTSAPASATSCARCRATCPCVVSTHQVDDLTDLFDTVVVMDHGRLPFSGTPDGVHGAGAGRQRVPGGGRLRHAGRGRLMVTLRTSLRAMPAFWFALPIVLLAGGYGTALYPSDHYGLGATAMGTGALPFIAGFAPPPPPGRARDCAGPSGGRPPVRSRLEVAVWAVLPSVLVGVRGAPRRRRGAARALRRHRARPDPPRGRRARPRRVGRRGLRAGDPAARPGRGAGRHPAALRVARLRAGDGPGVAPPPHRDVPRLLRRSTRTWHRPPSCASVLADLGILVAAAVLVAGGCRCGSAEDLAVPEPSPSSPPASSWSWRSACVGLVSGMTYAPVAPRDPPCSPAASASGLTLCLWPEHAPEADAYSPTVRRRRSGAGSRPASRRRPLFTEAGRSVAPAGSLAFRVAGAAPDDVVPALAEAMTPPQPECIDPTAGRAWARPARIAVHVARGVVCRGRRDVARPPRGGLRRRVGHAAAPRSTRCPRWTPSGRCRPGAPGLGGARRRRSSRRATRSSWTSPSGREPLPARPGRRGRRARRGRGRPAARVAGLVDWPATPSPTGATMMAGRLPRDRRAGGRRLGLRPGRRPTGGDGRPAGIAAADLALAVGAPAGWSPPPGASLTRPAWPTPGSPPPARPWPTSASCCSRSRSGGWRLAPVAPGPVPPRGRRLRPGRGHRSPGALGVDRGRGSRPRLVAAHDDRPRRRRGRLRAGPTPAGPVPVDPSSAVSREAQSALQARRWTGMVQDLMPRWARASRSRMVSAVWPSERHADAMVSAGPDVCPPRRRRRPVRGRSPGRRERSRGDHRARGS